MLLERVFDFLGINLFTAGIDAVVAAPQQRQRERRQHRGQACRMHEWRSRQGDGNAILARYDFGML